MNYAESLGCTVKGFAQLLTEAAIKYRPVLAEILKESSSQKLDEYSRSLYCADGGASPDFITAVANKTKSILGDRIAAKVKSQLSRVSSVHTGDHHALLCHPTPFQADVLCALGAQAQELPCMIALSFGDVPLNNKFYPRGAIWNGQMYPLFSNKWRHASVFGMRRAEKDVLGKLPAQIQEAIKPDLLSYELFSDQITSLNGSLWQHAFDSTSIPELVYLQAEDIACDLLTVSIKERSVLYRAIFETDIRSLVLQLFENIPGCWANGRGTHFFWARNGLGEMIQLRAEGAFLVPLQLNSGVLPIELDPDNIRDRLARHELIPSMFTTFGSFVLNKVRCLGGFQQNDYLAHMKLAWTELLTSLGDKAELDGLSRAVTRGYSFGPIFYLDKSQRPGSLDTVISNPRLEVGRLLDGFNTLTLFEANAIGLTQVYNIIVPENERDELLQKVSCSDVANEFISETLTIT